ncbi:2-succinyl-5-enolpyruvyl-6-hydroxy-3-cyclohexene-1-carboxylic-acid synthase [Cyanobacterium aponinum UTEX 3222]|uniref:2-succinyl-5-enolpyruvyl-6-hydroxy-3- cyclohexene-1-carboxylic-acid synthase n=1 Tax=Cyanobacterium aponinum TaxID=379064 RepID=UPI003088A986|nr:2-succinyl-5-enolpyruvyl-6-hydroxy-3-cyclohexene-1-carboxylic-acid synthase [Cyanobacterium aponinum UTEX 3222]
MSLDFRNKNILWSSLIVETFTKLGLEYAIISPGSRSTPLTVAFAENKLITSIPILDERSASFFALGLAKRTNKPVVLICTSGTAGANFYSAIIEAKYSHIPLIILTADRPFQLRNCHAGQTINQVNLYGSYPNWQTELSLPSAELEDLFYLRQNIIYGWEKAQFPSKGVVHFNIPFTEPLVPIEQLNFNQEKQDFIQKQLFSNFHLSISSFTCVNQDFINYLKHWQTLTKGIIIAGVDSPSQPELYCDAIASLAHILGFPVLAEALSPVRNYSHCNSHLITTYDTILRDEQYREKLIPEIVILIGEYPTSKELRKWLNQHKVTTYIITEFDDNFDALHSNSQHLRVSYEYLFSLLKTYSNNQPYDLKYLHRWLEIDNKISLKLNQEIGNNNKLFEGKIAWLLSQYLPEKTTIFIANSMSVRYAEFFWQKNNKKYDIYFSRGANGIDGTLSTALGVAYKQKITILLTGDLALLHDTNGFLINNHFQGCLIIILINNNGGGIFEMLPISNYENIFENYFATPQNINFQQLAKTYNIQYQLIQNWQNLEKNLSNLPSQNIHIWEIQTNRKEDMSYLKQLNSIIN